MKLSAPIEVRWPSGDLRGFLDVSVDVNGWVVDVAVQDPELARVPFWKRLNDPVASFEEWHRVELRLQLFAPSPTCRYETLECGDGKLDWYGGFRPATIGPARELGWIHLPRPSLWSIYA